MKEARVNPPEGSRNTSHTPGPRLSQESPTSKSGALSYSVASNPVYYSQGALHVLFAGASQTLPGHALGPKLYDYYLLHYVEKGAGTFRTELHTYDLHAGDCFLILPGQLVSYKSHERNPWQYRWIAFTGKQAAQLVEEAGFRPEKSVFHAGTSCEISNWLAVMQSAFAERKESAHFNSLGTLYMILAEAQNHLSEGETLTSGKSSIRRTVKQMIQYMSTQYAYPVSIEQMSESLGYNRAYLSRIFKQETGLTPVTYLLKLRIDKSRQLLRERPDLSIEQVSASVGMPDALYFSRQFKRFHGEAPSLYREKLLAGPLHPKGKADQPAK
ncbi:HTH-type transcriptional activator RhaS [Paenibacillus sp. JJ-100]|uniref:AraC family transcriptional regulator n=1 Tax=Paenibacillus sp. JJ-100 TaxID=2974896 RepID=UPI0022FF584C|nr:AraC family transcriptional regulator [Paenibacillus sp. JJ-100]CAI6078753.1 HTH-type transcriptional activator RhaS [Paenibacillus sp. JJ-100]